MLGVVVRELLNCETLIQFTNQALDPQFKEGLRERVREHHPQTAHATHTVHHTPTTQTSPSPLSLSPLCVACVVVGRKEGRGGGWWWAKAQRKGGWWMEGLDGVTNQHTINNAVCGVLSHNVVHPSVHSHNTHTTHRGWMGWWCC